MGHLGRIYEKYYTLIYIARDFQSIYFGSPLQDLLIESVARMGLLQDQYAPAELNDDQLDEVRNNPKLVALSKEREEYKNQLFCSILADSLFRNISASFRNTSSSKRNNWYIAFGGYIPE